ncbi:MAG: CvpA family protein [Zetaproteobacteria bacterium]|nr:MAG: CvpA family protein [Zetaproteobacteria bacterium]
MDAGLNILDYLLLAVIGISTIVSFYRGFIREAISLLGLIVAFFAAQQLSGSAGRVLSHWIANRGVADILGFVLVFIVALVVMGLIAAFLGKLMDLAELSGTDRGLGLLFGIARGLLLIAIAALLFMSYGKTNQNWVKRSQLAPYAMQLGGLLGTLLPANCPLSRQYQQHGHRPKPTRFETSDRDALKALLQRHLN